MQKKYTYDERFENIDFTLKEFPLGDYEQCHFINCNFNGVDISNCNFSDCIFKGCNLSVAKINKTILQNVEFNACKMIGFNLETCNSFALKVKFINCILNESSFYQSPLSKTYFKSCIMHNIDLSFADLSNSFLENCDLKDSIFDQTILEKANLTTAYNFNINPTENKVINASFSKENLHGLLNQFKIKIQ
ncbi:pentapeptide repeat-containing protein [Faecalibacter macacae]|uniref:Pentapeptide repeat-containing protein n=1 Tax=Faecalibacter macacae TaxID=1859289 RepID=A0A3L9MF35_9FLAO|nr:pentapeptide repeat-containing protein [Faecalibacter macacae]RLZ11445.1 pentapeptide repeat-containing protein [Faecalibacter macacae]